MIYQIEIKAAIELLNEIAANGIPDEQKSEYLDSLHHSKVMLRAYLASQSLCAEKGDEPHVVDEVGALINDIEYKILELKEEHQLYVKEISRTQRPTGEGVDHWGGEITYAVLKKRKIVGVFSHRYSDSHLCISGCPLCGGFTQEYKGDLKIVFVEKSGYEHLLGTKGTCCGDDVLYVNEK